MKVQEDESNVLSVASGTATNGQNQIFQKIHNATLKKFYEAKIVSLDDRSMSPHLLRMMCQDVPVKSDNLESKWRRNWFVHKCKKFYQHKLKEIDRSEKKGFCRFFL